MKLIINIPDFADEQELASAMEEFFNRDRRKEIPYEEIPVVELFAKHQKELRWYVGAWLNTWTEYPVAVEKFDAKLIVSAWMDADEVGARA